ncbi:MAG: tetratricopeptide repeat protein [Acidobacteria bacterium]|nr:tetratricopeptide repeat protein [Acidobacteriota bacterium]
MAASLSPKIQDLAARLNRDPDSKIFLQLAEEYRKEGLLEEALLVCKGGLKKHPGYQSARVAMGRIFLSLNLLEEARVEFEAVLRAAPDNLLANRLLGDLLVKLGDTETALGRYRAVQMYGPSDPDIAVKIQKLEGGQSPLPPPPAAPAGPATAPAAVRAASALRPATTHFPTPAQQRTPGPLPATEEEPAPGAEARPPAATPAEAAVPTTPPSPVARPSGEADRLSVPPPVQAAKKVEETRPAASPASPEPAPEPEPAPVPESPAATLTLQGGAAPAAGAQSQAKAQGGLKKPRDGINTETLAELYVRQGFIERAMDVYRCILSYEPENRDIRRRLRELEPMMLKKERMKAPVPLAGDAPRNSPPATQPPAGSIERLERWLKAIQAGRP